MSKEEIILKLTEVLIWPLTILAIILLLKNQLSLLISKITRVKYKEIEVLFEELKAKVTNMQLNEKPHKIPHTNDTQNSLISLAIESPESAIILAWRSLETALRETLTKLNLQPTINSTGISSVLLPYIGKEKVSLINTMRRLRNEITHNTRFEQGTFTTERAIEYIENTDYIKGFLDAIIEEGSSNNAISSDCKISND